MHKSQSEDFNRKNVSGRKSEASISSSQSSSTGFKSPEPDIPDPYAINSPNFEPTIFITKIIQEYPLPQLMHKEKKLIREIQDLDSDMQTLVYENYNKFILATDTIRKMKTDFKEMEDKMGLLSENITKINESSASISSSLQEKRQKVSKLSSINDLLKKLKFLFELPNKLKQFCEDSNHEEAVRCYLNGLTFLEEFKSFPSLEGIKEDCQEIVLRIKSELYLDFEDESKSSQDLTRNVSLLLSLKELPSSLTIKMIENSRPKLAHTLNSLKSSNNPNVALDEFMELSCGIFLSNLSLFIASFSQAFIQSTELSEESRGDSQNSLKIFIESLMEEFLEILKSRLSIEVKDPNQDDTEGREIFLKALDRLYRRLMAMETLMPNTDFTQMGLRLILQITQTEAELNLSRLKKSFEKGVIEGVAELRSSPASSQEVLGSILANFILHLKSGVKKILQYLGSEFQFAQNQEFRQRVGVNSVREGLVVESFKYLTEFGNRMTKIESDPITCLLISKLYLDIEIGTVEFMVNSVESEFEIKRDRRISEFNLTNVSDLSSGLSKSGRSLLEEFVSNQGNELAELMKETIINNGSVSDSKDEDFPKGTQKEMRKMIEILGRVEKYAESIFPDTDTSSYLKSERSSDSSKRSYSTLPGISNKISHSSHKSNWSNIDRNMSSNIQKLFSEKVDIFGKVGYQKSSIITSIVKIALRALLEHVRMNTLTKKDLQQIQVDLQFLQLYLWRFVNNESFLYSLLDEILTSSTQRCIDPVLLPASTVEKLAEKTINY